MSSALDALCAEEESKLESAAPAVPVSNVGSGCDALGIVKAFNFIANKYKGATKQGEPVIDYCISVVWQLANECQVSNPAVLTAAILNDSVESGDVSFNELKSQFGDEVHNILFEIIGDKSLPFDEWRDAQLANAAGKSAEAKLLEMIYKCAALRGLDKTTPFGWEDKTTPFG